MTSRLVLVPARLSPTLRALCALVFALGATLTPGCDGGGDGGDAAGDGDLGDGDTGDGDGGDGDGDACPAGTEGCACYGNGTCNDGLGCDAELCLAIGGDGDGDAVDGDGDGDGDGDTGDGDGDGGDADGDSADAIVTDLEAAGEITLASQQGNPSAFQAGYMIITDDTDLTACAMTEPVDDSVEIAAYFSYQMDYDCEGIIPICDADECDDDRPGAAFARRYAGGDLVTEVRATGGALSFTYDSTNFEYTCTIAVDIAFPDGGLHTQTYVMPHSNEFMCAEFSTD